MPLPFNGEGPRMQQVPHMTCHREDREDAAPRNNHTLCQSGLLDICQQKPAKEALCSSAKSQRRVQSTYNMVQQSTSATACTSTTSLYMDNGRAFLTHLQPVTIWIYSTNIAPAINMIGSCVWMSNNQGPLTEGNRWGTHS